MSSWSIVCVICAVLMVMNAAQANVNTSTALGPYKVSSITVSGVSSGAYMAVQMHISYSMLISGIAAFAGGPFYCAEGTIAYAETRCMDGTFGGPQVSKLVDLTYSDARLNFIDDPSNLKNDKVFVFSGLSDTVITSEVVHSLQAYYSYFMDASRIETSYDVNAEHCLPTLNYGEDCQVLSSPYLGNCNYDGAGVALKSLYGALNERVAKADASRLFQFSQVPYITDRFASLGDVGYIYVPTACENGLTSCRLHISFHGCEQNIELIGDAYAVHGGFNEWAESNDIIVLYPYAKVSSKRPVNPNGCWDWWGYTNSINYGVKSGVQMEFIRSLIKAVTGA